MLWNIYHFSATYPCIYDKKVSISEYDISPINHIYLLFLFVGFSTHHPSFLILDKKNVTIVHYDNINTNLNNTNMI
jgi:hypothetical protein